MIAIVAYNGLKARRQKTHFFSLQSSRAGGADEQIRKNPRQTQHPNFEITPSEVDRTTLLESAYRHANEPEHGILRFVFRQEPVYQFDQMACTLGFVTMRLRANTEARMDTPSSSRRPSRLCVRNGNSLFDAETPRTPRHAENSTEHR